MSPALWILTTAWLPAQCIDAPVQPPHQRLWTCSSMLKCRNEMSCHEVGEVSLPFLDCLGHICDRLCPRKRRQPIRFDGLNTAPMYPYNTGPGYSAWAETEYPLMAPYDGMPMGQPSLSYPTPEELPR